MATFEQMGLFLLREKPPHGGLSDLLSSKIRRDLSSTVSISDTDIPLRHILSTEPRDSIIDQCKQRVVVARIGQGGINGAISDPGTSGTRVAIDDSIWSGLGREKLHRIDDSEKLTDIDGTIRKWSPLEDEFAREHIDALSLEGSGVPTTGSVDRYGR